MYSYFTEYYVYSSFVDTFSLSYQRTECYEIQSTVMKSINIATYYTMIILSSLAILP